MVVSKQYVGRGISAHYSDLVEPDNGCWFDSEGKVGVCFQAWLVVGSSPRRMLVPSTVDGDGFVDTEDVGWKDFDLEVVVAWFQARWRWMLFSILF